MARKPTDRQAMAEALDKGLEAMFRALKQRPTPDRIASVVDQLDVERRHTPEAAAKKAR